MQSGVECLSKKIRIQIVTETNFDMYTPLETSTARGIHVTFVMLRIRPGMWCSTELINAWMEHFILGRQGYPSYRVNAQFKG